MSYNHFGWDYEESITNYYHIYPISDYGEVLMEDSLTFDIGKNDENDIVIERIVKSLNTLCENNKICM